MIVFEVAMIGVAQVALEVMTQEIRSLLAKATYVYMLLFEPTSPPFNFH